MGFGAGRPQARQGVAMRSEIPVPVLPFQRFTSAFDFGRINGDAEHRDQRLMLEAPTLVVELPCARNQTGRAVLGCSDFRNVLSGQLAVLHGVELPHVTRSTSTPSVANNHPGWTRGNWRSKGQGGKSCSENPFHRSQKTEPTILSRAVWPHPADGGFW
jgi:hypothetical protein